ncbi:MAG: hypothetical protein JXR96_04325 [Deltaproteobacteria bacterium]|nr:hypothetical protein [Deltaproteobacteria bacterium]
MGSYSYMGWRPYVPVAERRRRAAKKIDRLEKAGRNISPVEIPGRKITSTFWGNAWCRNLEAYSDYSNRLPRGRTYVRNGSVLDLQVEPGRVLALVCGTELYDVEIRIKPLSGDRWAEIKRQCVGQIGSVVELLKGAISGSVMEIVTRKGEGLFPSPREIKLSCSCPDWAVMCKHVAASLYGVGARLDHQPELLFTLRGVDPAEMVAAAVDLPVASGGEHESLILQADGLSSIFGVDIDEDSLPGGPESLKRAYVKPDFSTEHSGQEPPRQKAVAGIETPRKARASRTPRRPGRRARKRYSAKRRAALLKQYQDLHATGMTAQAAAIHVGVPYITLRSWEVKAGKGSSARRRRRPSPLRRAAGGRKRTRKARKTGRSGRRRYSAAEKTELLEDYQALRALGLTAHVAAKRVGVPYITLRSWEKKA